MTVPLSDRPFRHEDTSTLRAALDLARTHARQAARFNPGRQNNPLPAVVDLLHDELQQRGETAT